jgi:hypothetical protein
VLEAEVTGRLEHPGVVPVYGLGTYPDGRPYYAMRFIKGESFDKAIRASSAAAPRKPATTFRHVSYLTSRTQKTSRCWRRAWAVTSLFRSTRNTSRAW